jgi:hypothetical protein
VLAACVLEALGWKATESADGEARALVGALVLVEAAQDLKVLRKFALAYAKAMKEQRRG